MMVIPSGFPAHFDVAVFFRFSALTPALFPVAIISATVIASASAHVLIASASTSAFTPILFLKMTRTSWLIYLNRNILKLFSHVQLKECGCKLHGCNVIVIHLIGDNLGHLGQILLVSDLHNL